MEHKPFSILVVDDEPDIIPLIKQRMRSYIRSHSDSRWRAWPGA